MLNPSKNTICLWYDGDAEGAARFYAKSFPDSSVGAVHRAPGDFPSGKKGDVLTVEFAHDNKTSNFYDELRECLSSLCREGRKKGAQKVRSGCRYLLADRLQSAAVRRPVEKTERL